MEDAIALAAALKAEPSIPAALAELRGRPAAPGGEPSARGAGEPRVVRVGGALPRHRAAPVRLQPAHPQPSHHPREPAGARSRRWWRRWTAGSPSRPARQSGQPVPLDPCPPPLFTPYRLRELVLPNRIVVSSMCQYRAEDGLPNDWHLVHLGSRAIGGAGLVMAEMTDVSREGRISPGCAGMYLPEHVEGWRRIVDFVHGESEAKIGMQLSHAGRKGSTRLLWEGEDEPLPEGNWPLIAPSPIPYRPHNQTPREMTRARHGPGGRRLRPRHRDGRRRRVRSAGAAPGARLSAGLVHLAAHQPADRRVRRIAGQPDALSRWRS